PVHGARQLVCGSRRSRNARREGGARLVSAIGAGLGGLRQYVRRAAADGVLVLRTDHAAVPLARPPAILAEGSGAVVAATASDYPVRGSTLTLREVSHRFDLEGQPLPVLDRISLHIGRGEFVALLGPSGCGKSTLLRLVAGLDPPSAGGLFVEGEAIEGPDPSRIVVFQDPTLYPWRSVWGNVALGLEARGLLRTHRERIADALRLVGLRGLATAFHHQLSGGMSQRTALARALVNDPKLLILDEPLGQLDSLTRITMQSELVSLWQRSNFTALLVTHDGEEALFLAGRVIVLSQRPARIKAEITNPMPYPRHRGDP